MQRPKTQYAKCGDLHIAYQVIGDGPVDLLYAQGWLSNVEYAWESPHYARFLTRLGRFCRLIFFDKRGTGMSDREVGLPTLEQRSEDINAILDDVGSEKAALLGVSEGGAITSVFAASYPDRVSKLILCGCRSRYLWAPDYPIGIHEDEVEESIRYFVDNWGEPFHLDSGAPSMTGDMATAEWFAAYLRFSASASVATAITRMNYSIDIRDVLPAIRVPTLVLHSEHDQWCPVEHAKYSAQRIPGAELRILPVQDHIPFFDEQDAYIAEIKEFVTGERAAPASERALLTVVFMDLEDSTGQLAKLGDDHWRGLLEQWDVSISRRVGLFGGRQVKHTGDGYLLTFPGPTSAIEFSQAVQRDVERLGLRCRTGIHTGECERRGDDLSGMAVHIASRIMSEADGGKIACSGTVRDLAVGSGLEFNALGERSLKGVPGEWPLFAV